MARNPLTMSAALAAAALGTAAIAVPAAATGTSPQSETATSEATNAKYTSIEPRRAIDTRSDLGVDKAGDALLASGKLSPAESTRGDFKFNFRDFLRDATGVKDLEPDAVELNLTATDPSSDGFLSVWNGGEWSGTSNLNFGKNDTRANSATIALDENGFGYFYANVPTHLVVDVFGYFEEPADATQGFVSGSPKRVWDSRTEQQVSLKAGEPLSLSITNENAHSEAVVINVTTVNAAEAGYLAAYPKGVENPGTAILHYDGPEPTAAHAAIQLGEQSSITLYSQRDTDVIVDVFALYADSNGDADNPEDLDAGLVVTKPTRMYDSREVEDYTPAARKVTNVKIVKDGSPVPADATTAFVSLAGIGREGGYLTAADDFTEPAKVSHLNYGDGDVRMNTVPVPLNDDGTIDIYTFGAADIVIDVVGYATK